MHGNILETIRRFKTTKPDLEQCVDLLVKLQMNKGPIIEVITVLRHENPTLFSWLKPRLAFRPMLLMTLDIQHDYSEAVHKLSAASGGGAGNAAE